jgi:hypothetical protein
MKRVLLATAALLALTASSHAAIIGTFGINPNSSAGAFSNDPNGPGLGGLFEDEYTFTLVGGPQFVTIASATNVFPGGNLTTDFISAFTGRVFQQLGGVPNPGTDPLLLGPATGAPCIEAPDTCQRLAGSAILNPGNYYLDISGNAGISAGYGGNLAVAAVPGPIVGAGIPGLLGMLGFGGFRFWRRKQEQGQKQLATA